MGRGTHITAVALGAELLTVSLCGFLICPKGFMIDIKPVGMKGPVLERVPRWSAAWYDSTMTCCR